MYDFSFREREFAENFTSKLIPPNRAIARSPGEPFVPVLGQIRPIAR